MTETKVSRKVVDMYAAAGPQPPIMGLTMSSGAIKLDVRLDSSVEDGEIRFGIRKNFLEAVGHLTGLKTETDQGDLVKYLNNGLTSTPDMVMPSHGKEMLDKLNDTYLAEICKYCTGTGGNPPPLSLYDAVPLTGQDYYCIGEDGKTYCYHNFGLTEKFGTGGLFTVKYSTETCPVCLVCIGLAVDGVS